MSSKCPTICDSTLAQLSPQPVRSAPPIRCPGPGCSPPVRRQNALGVRGSRAAYPVSASLGPRNDNLAPVAWSGSLRIHVDVHNQALLLGRLIELPVAGPVEQRHCRVILDILAGAHGMQAPQRRECPRGLDAKGVLHLPAKVRRHMRQS